MDTLPTKFDNCNAQTGNPTCLTSDDLSIMIVYMSNHMKWTAGAVKDALADVGRSKTSLSDETGIPYSTLNRKVAAKAEFSFSELLLIAEALGVSPSAFTPPPFQKRAVVVKDAA